MYTTVYELDSWTLWKSYVFAPGIGVELLLLFAVAVACVVFGMVRRRPLVLLGAMPFLIMATFFVPVMRREFEWGRALLDLYTRGGCQVVEGRTRVEAQQRLEGHSIDRIVIGGVPLAISHFELGPQYRKSIVYGGALKEGVDARVWHCPAKAFQREGSGPIVRVDVKNRQDAPRGPRQTAFRRSNTVVARAADRSHATSSRWQSPRAPDSDATPLPRWCR